MRQNTGATRGARIAIRLSQEDRVRIDEAVKARGYTSPSARYFMLEVTNGHVYHVYRTPEIEELRSRRGLQINSFIRFRKLSTVRGPVVEMKDMGDSEAILTNKAHLRETAREMIRRGVYPQDGGWSGWLGRYQKALVDTAFAVCSPIKAIDVTRPGSIPASE
jgi:hypothetical protein